MARPQAGLIGPAAARVAAALLVTSLLTGCARPRPRPAAEPLDAEGQALAAIPARTDIDSYRAWIGPAPAEPPPAGFAVRQIDGRWWLVAPSGRLYWASALRHAGCGLETDGPVTPYRDALLHKWGAGLFGVKCPARVLDRMAGWGFTAIGTASSDSLFRPRVLPFLTPGLMADKLSIPLAAPGLPDAFLGDLVVKLSPALSPLANWQDAPFCLGHPGGVRADWSGLAASVLALPAKAPAKVEWIRTLREAYGKIAVLNRAWGVSATSFEALRWPGDGKATDIAKADLMSFRARFADWLYAAVLHAIRFADKTHLMFGMAVVPGVTPPEVTAALAKHADVIVVEVGDAEPALPAIEALAAQLHRPLYVIAARPAAVGPAELPAAWSRVMERLAAMSDVVGAEVSDYLPNADGSAFVGWDDVPEILLTEAARRTNDRLLRLHAGQPEPAPKH
ncbi:MAG: hypothetical protein AAB152_04200 [Candidatus Coatesbacteria bacterium]